MSRATFGYMTLLLACAVSCGCYNLRRPSLFHPGPTDYQRYNAIQHDPYPDPHMGPETGGMRPREYDRPPDESQRYPLRRGGAAPLAPQSW